MLFACLCLCLLLTNAAFLRAAPLEGGGQGGGGGGGGGEGEGGVEGVEGGGGGEGGRGVESLLSQPTSVTTGQGGGGGGEEEEEEDEEEDEDYYEYDALEEDTLPSHPPISDNLPRFIANLADGNLLCYSIKGFELFTYNLLTSSHVHVNSFVNITQLPSGEWVRGNTDLGFLMKIEDSRVRSGIRVFKATVDGAKKRAVLAGFGEVDMRGGAVSFSIDSSGHSNIESGEAEHEQFSLAMERPQVSVWAVSSDGLTYNVYVEKGSGLWEEPTHGIIGQFINPEVKIDMESGQLLLGSERDPVPVQEGPMWDSVRDRGYQDRTCWYPQDGVSILEGEPYDYVTEYILAHKYKFSQFDPKPRK